MIERLPKFYDDEKEKFVDYNNFIYSILSYSYLFLECYRRS